MLSTDTNQRQFSFLLYALAAFVGIYLLSPVLTPFLVAILIAYVANPSVSKLEHFGMPRWASILIGVVFLASMLVLAGLLLIPTLQTQLSSFIDKIPEYLEKANQWAEPISSLFNPESDNSQTEPATVSETLRSLGPDALPVTGEAAVATVDAIKASASLVSRTLANLFLIPVIGFYLLRDWNLIISKLSILIPTEFRERLTTIAREVDEVLKSFLYGQFLVMCALGAMYSAGLYIVGLEFSLLIGVMAGVLSFVPFLGTGIGVIVASIVSFMQTDQLLDVWKVLVVFAAGQFIEGNLLTPKLVGEKINLHPVIVIFAVLAGGELFGFTGILFALPVAAVAWVVIKDIATGETLKHD